MTSVAGAFFLPFHGLTLLFSPGLRRFLLVPLTINVLLYLGLGWVAYLYFDDFLNWLLPADSWLSYLSWLLWPIFALAYLAISFYTFTILANLIGSPFNSRLAEQIEARLTGRTPPAANETLLTSILPALLGELNKLSYFLIRAIPLLILMFIPGINALASVLWLLLGFWFLALEYGDYPMGNHGLKPGEQRARLKAKRFSSLAFGAGVSLLMMIPVVNFAAMPAAVAGATRYWVDQLNDA